jgi:hypothetical protein
MQHASGMESRKPHRRQMQFECDEQSLVLHMHDLFIAGWTGRDADAVEHHIAELEAIGIPRPRTTPMFYRVGTNLLTTDVQVDVTGPDTSGEVECVLVSLPKGLFVGVGSDHTDRKVEAYGVTVSKQVCPKPMCKHLWPMLEVIEHWDSLILRSWVTCDGVRRLYQEGSVAKMLSPSELIGRYTLINGLFDFGTVMFGGTLPVMEGISGGERFEMELEDPVLKRSLEHAYGIRSLAFTD